MNTSQYCTLTNNRSDLNSGHGFYAFGSRYHVLDGNTSFENGQHGFRLQGSSHENVLINNLAQDNDQTGFSIYESDSAVLRLNRSLSNDLYGFELYDAPFTVMTRNTIDSNTSYGLYITIAATLYCTVEKNNFVPSVYADRIDSSVYNNAGIAFDLKNNYWWGTNEDSMTAAINGPGEDSTPFIPYRLNKIDTAITADTIAPAIPDGVTADTSVYGQITITWPGVYLNEDSTVMADFDYYAIYRAGDTQVPLADWYESAWLMDYGDTTFVDTTVLPGETYYYRITCVDNHTPWENESWFSDTVTVIAAGGFVDNGNMTVKSAVGEGTTFTIQLPKA